MPRQQIDTPSDVTAWTDKSLSEEEAKRFRTLQWIKRYGLEKLVRIKEL